ncbi:MAG: 4Fe-4S binding protein [Nitrospirota bacterium]|nr:MAG: 4Fe-4S binding protein [Nitrospirota bacterium]
MAIKDVDIKKRQYARPYIRRARYVIQWYIVAAVLIGGVSLNSFYRSLLAGADPSFTKPLSVEGFMPIGALMSLKLWLASGLFDPVHPAALVLFISALLLATALKKGFCGWICPVGTISESIWKLGKRVFGRNFKAPSYIDIPLRSLKYILMTFFLYVILIKMSPVSIRSFLFTPYWKVADFKLLMFFTEMSMTTLIVLASLFSLSLLYRNFWCRYLCPYGALLGLLSMLSPLKVTRNNDNCIHCGTCSKVCPSHLPVESKVRLRTPECIGCASCVSRCPSEGALELALPRGRVVRPYLHIALISIIFFGSILVAMASGHWKSNVTVEEYRRILPVISSLQHP